MRIAWFAPAHVDTADRDAGRDDADALDDTAVLLDELAATHQVVRYDQRNAHEFVWQHARAPYALCVYELSNSQAADCLWPYALHYPGLVRLRSAMLQRSRARALRRTHGAEHYAAELAAGGAGAILLAAARMVVVADRYFADTLRHLHPAARIRHAPLGVPGPHRPEPGESGRRPVFRIIDTSRLDVVQRAAGRARDAGSRFEISVSADRVSADGIGADPAAAVERCDVVVAMRWPASVEPPLGALLAMASSRAAIVYETGATAGWPAFDPQTWQPRGLQGDSEPVVVSIDPRDEEHSLMLAFRRLADDAPLRRRIGNAAYAWWAANATPAAAAHAWRGLLAEAASLEPPERPSTWPPHLTADGTERAREMLAPFGVTVDVLEPLP